MVNLIKGGLIWTVTSLWKGLVFFTRPTRKMIQYFLAYLAYKVCPTEFETACADLSIVQAHIQSVEGLQAEVDRVKNELSLWEEGYYDNMAHVFNQFIHLSATKALKDKKVGDILSYTNAGLKARNKKEIKLP